MSRPLLLDLYCGAGGAGVGYSRAGFDVVGVDIGRQPRYPFPFHQADALDPSAWLEATHGRLPDAIHASPPCQHYSQAVKIAKRDDHPDLIAATRELLRASGVPYVIENVVRAPLLDAITLCGSSFGLPIRRHRRFESSVFLMSRPCAHNDVAYPRQYPPAWNRETPLRVLSISGGYQNRRHLGDEHLEMHKAAMGVDWPMTLPELSESIPPAYTEWIGRQLLGW